jgi:hypothetical protein
MIGHSKGCPGYGKLELPHTDGEKVKWHNHFGKQFGSFLKSSSYTHNMI